jgi:hypothetical protein
MAALSDGGKPASILWEIGRRLLARGGYLAENHCQARVGLPTQAPVQKHLG